MTPAGNPPARKPRPHERSFTVMVMGRAGKVRSFRISRRLVLWAVLFFAAYVPFSVYLVNRYFELRNVNASQRVQLERLERDLLRGSSALSRSKEHIALLENHILQMEKPAEQAIEPSRTPEKQADAVARKPDENVISVQDVVAENQGGKLTVRFKLVNLLPDGSSVSGYVFILARNDKSPPVPEWTYPQANLVNGLPENYKRGKLFIIQKFKPIQGTLAPSAGQDSPKTIQILVYDQAGELLLNQDFEIAA